MFLLVFDESVMNQAGQESAVFRLLIAAIVALVILAILIGIFTFLGKLFRF